jgi:hypothetical protein
MSRALRIVGTGLAAAVIARVQAAVRPDTLEELLRVGREQEPSWQLCDVVVQDEFTHDVVVQGPAPAFLVFDTT